MAQNQINFVKMNGLGNKIIVADMRDRTDRITPDAAVALARDEDTAFDQIMAVHQPRGKQVDASIQILNSDGSNAESCGNGMRCVVSWIQRELGKEDFQFETENGLIEAHYQDDDCIRINMGMPRFDWEQIPLSEEFADTRTIELQIGPIDDPILHTPSAANIGNPHAVFWVENDVWSYELDRFGPLLENHPIFPERANITIAQVTSQKAITIRTWERGAGITKACGSAACATTVNGSRTARTGRNVTITTPGGDLEVEWRPDNFIMMSGPGEYEFSGLLDPLSGEWVRKAADK